MDSPSIVQLIQDVGRFARDFYEKKNWGEIRITFRCGVPMNINLVGGHADSWS